MDDRRVTGRRPNRCAVIPVMVLYLIVMALAPWLHLRAHETTPAPAVLGDAPSPEGETVAPDICELCRVLGGAALLGASSRMAHPRATQTPEPRAARFARHGADTDARPRAPPASPHAA